MTLAIFVILNLVLVIIERWILWSYVQQKKIPNLLDSVVIIALIILHLQILASGIDRVKLLSFVNLSEHRQVECLVPQGSKVVVKSDAKADK